MSTIETLIDQQIKAYNQKDLANFVNCYAEDITILVNGETKLEGIAPFTQHYKKVFDSSPKLNATILERMVLNNHVIDIEEIDGRNGQAAPQKVTAKYTVENDLISKVDFLNTPLAN